jgi:hypothetical protein
MNFAVGVVRNRTAKCARKQARRRRIALVRCLFRRTISTDSVDAHQGIQMKDMSADRARTIDAGCKILGTLGVLIGGFIGLFNYLSTREHESYVRELEARKPAFEERLNLCVNLTTAAGKAATSDNPKELKQAKKDFAAIVWGPLDLVGNGDISESAKQFNLCVESSSPCKESVTELSRDIALACRKSLGPNWGFGEPNPPQLTISTQ